MASASGSLKAVNTAMRNISKGPDLREEMALVAGVDANWEEFLVPGPICVALLGDLLLISTATDFTLDKSPPKDGFKLLKYPKSFRACLTQVTNSGYDAFNMAHKNMDQIRLRSGKVTDQVKQAVEILLRGRDEELEGMLPIPLGAIQDTADKCLTLSKQVEEKFIFVMDLTAELLEACVSAEGGYEKDIRQTHVALTIAKENRIATEEREKMAKKNLEDVERAVKASEKAYTEAMESMPSGWKMIGMNFVEGITTGFTNRLAGLRTKCTKSKPKLEAAKCRKPQKTDDDTLEAYFLADKMVPFVDSLVSTVCSGEDLNLKALGNTTAMSYCKKQLACLLKDARPLEGVVKERVFELCSVGMDICTKLEDVSDQFQMNPEKAKDIVLRLLALQGEIRSLSAEGRVLSGANPTDLTPPNQAAFNPDENLSAVQQAVQVTRFKIEQTSSHLNHTRENYDKACERKAESSRKLHEIIGEMKQLDIESRDFEQIKSTLVKGIKALGELREKWGKIVMFFQMMSNIIESSLNVSLKGFLQYAKVTSEQTLSYYPMTKLKRDMIYQQAFEAAKIAHLVNMISGSYVKVSEEHLMDKIAGLGKLLGYDPEKEKPQIRQERKKLFEGCEDAQSAIRDLVLQRKLEFDSKINARMEAVRRELESVIPPIQDSGESQRRIEQSAKKAIAAVQEIENKEETSLLSDELMDQFSDI